MRFEHMDSRIVFRLLQRIILINFYRICHDVALVCELVHKNGLMVSDLQNGALKALGTFAKDSRKMYCKIAACKEVVFWPLTRDERSGILIGAGETWRLDWPRSTCSCAHMHAGHVRFWRARRKQLISHVFRKVVARSQLLLFKN